MPTVASEVAKSTVIGRPEAPDRRTVKVAVPAASLTVTSSIESSGAASLSTMLATPVEGAASAPLTGVAVNVKVSVFSSIASSVVARRSCTLVLPGAIETLPDTVDQVAPLSVETSRVFAAAVSVPMPALPEASVGVKTTALVLGLDRLTVKMAGAPSTTLVLLTDSDGVSLSLPPVPVPSSLMRPMPVASAIAALTGEPRLTEKVSVPSKTASLTIGTATVRLVTPGSKTSVPLRAP